MADRLAQGRLVDILRHRRGDDGLSFNQITRGLFADFGIEVTAQTVSNWCELLAITVDTPASGEVSA